MNGGEHPCIHPMKTMNTIIEPNPKTIEELATEFNSRAASALQAQEELRRGMLRQMIALLRTQIEHGRVLLEEREQRGKGGLRRFLLERKTDFKVADNAMKLAKMKVNFDKEESVLRALKVMGLAESVVRELRSQK